MPKDKNYDHGIDLKKYQAEDSVGLREMNIGLWLSEKREFLMRLLIIFLIMVSAGFFIYSAYQYFIYFRSSSDKTPLTENTVVSPHNIIADLKIDAPQFFRNGAQYDLTVKITNPNDKFGALFDACFNLSGTEFTCAKSFILPGETKYVFALAKEVKDDVKTLSFNAKNISWQRIDTHNIPDWNAFSASRLNFAFADISFYSLADAGGGEKSGNILEFNAQNLSPYSYYDLPLNIALFDGAQMLSVNVYHLQNFLSGETRNIKINWPGNYRNIRAEIVPDLNILDNAVYLKYQGSPAS